MCNYILQYHRIQCQQQDQCRDLSSQTNSQSEICLYIISQYAPNFLVHETILYVVVCSMPNSIGILCISCHTDQKV